VKLDARSAALLLPLLAFPAVAAEHGATRRADNAARGETSVPPTATSETLPSDSARDPDDEQAEAARHRELAVNLFLCANALPGCDPSRLTPEQRARFLADQPPSQ
jgi:hypothetical protein